jgi:hypothetical protein
MPNNQPKKWMNLINIANRSRKTRDEALGELPEFLATIEAAELVKNNDREQQVKPEAVN